MAKLRVKILSYNVRGDTARWSRSYLGRVARTIAESGADVVGLQEVRRGTSGLADQAETLGKLTGLSARFGRSFTRGACELGNAVLTRGEVLSAEVHPLPGSGEPRSLLHSRIALTTGEIDFFVTHLAAWSRWGRAARSLQVQDLVERLRQEKRPFVLAGDFNAPPGAPEIATLMAAELFRMCGDDVAVTHRFMRQRIDYVFASPGWTTDSYRVIRSGPSDHWPVLVELHRETEGI